MATNAIYTVKYRRKREGRTHYKKRLELLKSGKTRLVIRRTNTAFIVQFVNYEHDGDKIVCTYNSKKLETLGWNYSKKSLPAGYLAGLSAGKEALAKGVREAILDIGLQTPIKGSRVYAVLKGIVDAGLDVPHSPDVFPSEERVGGEHISNAKDLPKTFADIKGKLL
jgi:large subunit ribosomal protein L18